MKKLPTANEPPVNSIKGTGVVDAPPEFLLRLLQDPIHTTTLDDMLKETRVVEQLSPAVALVQLLYKAVWPTSPRDFAVLSVAGQINDTTWVSSGSSIQDDRILPEKGYVRGDLLGGGYVIHSMPNKPGKSIVTYTACVNLKGSIPAFVVNKIAESQPMCVNNLRKLAEPLHKKMAADPQAMADFQAKFPLSKAFEYETTREAVPTDQSAADAAPLSKTVAHTDGAGASPSPPHQIAAASPMLQERLAQSQWHFDPSLPPVSSEQVPEALEDDTPKSQSAQVGADDTHRFQTPPIDSDHEDTGSTAKLASHNSRVNSPSDPSDSAHEPRSSSSSSLAPLAPAQETHEPRSRASSAPSSHAALQLSQYTPTNGHLPGQQNVGDGIHP